MPPGAALLHRAAPDSFTYAHGLAFKQEYMNWKYLLPALWRRLKFIFMNSCTDSPKWRVFIAISGPDLKQQAPSISIAGKAMPHGLAPVLPDICVREA